jgi:hypothetical protein
MADDVKVKFGGDFSEVPKGAEQAAKTAGTAMKDWFKDFGKSIVAPIAGFFAADAILGQIKDFVGGMREQLTVIREMNHAIKKSGLDSQEFQGLAAVARQSGISMQDLGKALNFANVYIAKAQAGSESHRKTLRTLFNTTEDLNYSTLKSSDVVYRLADAFQDASQEGDVLALVSEILGKRAGLNLIPMFEQSGKAIKKQAEETKKLTDAELEAAEALDKVVRNLERKKAMMEREAVVAVAVHERERDLIDAEREAYLKMGDEQFKRTPEENKKVFIENLLKEYKSKEIPVELGAFFYKNSQQAFQHGPYATADESSVKQNIRDEVFSSILAGMEKETAAPKVGKFTEGGSGGMAMGEGAPSSGVIGFGNNSQLLLMTDQLDVLKEIQRILEDSRSPNYAPDFTKSMVNIKVPPTPTIPNPAK